MGFESISISIDIEFLKSQYQDWYQLHFAPASTLKYMVKLIIFVILSKEMGILSNNLVSKLVSDL